MQRNDLKHTANDAVAQTRSFVSDQLDTRATQIGEHVSSAAADLRRIADELRKGETVSGGADLATRGAVAIDRVGQYLQNADGDRLIADVEAFARQRPWAVTMAALAAGFAASRVLKASSARRYRSSGSSLSYGGNAPYASGVRTAAGTGGTVYSATTRKPAYDNASYGVSTSYPDEAIASRGAVADVGTTHGD